MRNKPKNEIKPFDKGMLVGISFEGPLPHPDILKKYKEIDSLVLKLLLENVKLEGNNRRKSEYKTASRKADMPLFGLIAAFSVCVFAMLVAAYFFYKQYNTAGITFMSALLGTIITSFLKNTSNK